LWLSFSHWAQSLHSEVQSLADLNFVCWRSQAQQEVKKLTVKLQGKELEAQPGMTMLETFESNVNQVLNKARDDAGTFAQNSLLPTNNVVRMVTAGSKGSFINISQVTPPPSGDLSARVDLFVHNLEVVIAGLTCSSTRFEASVYLATSHSGPASD